MRRARRGAAARALLAAAAGAPAAAQQLNAELCRQLIGRNASGLNTLSQLFDNQKQQSNSRLYGAAVLSTVPGSSSQEVSWRTTGAFGSSRIGSSSRPMGIDTPVRIGSVSEVLVVAAALLMPSIANNLDSQVAEQFMPNNLPLRNPAQPSQDITYRMLMQHTSSLMDTRYTSYMREPSCPGSPPMCCQTRNSPCESAMPFRTFIEQLFSEQGTSRSLDPTMFSARSPGAESSYQPAHINIALLAYVMDSMILSGAPGTALQSPSTDHVGSFIEEKILYPLGMGNTFYLTPQGNAPRLENSHLSPVAGMMAVEYDTSGTASLRYVHPNYPADVMQWSSASDLGMRLAGTLFAPYTPNGDMACDQAALCAVGRRMRDTTISVSGNANARTFQLKQGLGVQFYDPVVICQQTIASGLYSKCPLKAGHNVWGMVSGGTATDRTAVAGLYCTDAAGGSGTRAGCVSVVQVLKDVGASPTDPSMNLAMAGGAFQETFGESEPPKFSQTDDDDDLYGLWVFFGVVGTIGFVLVASYFTEFLIQPQPAASGTGKASQHAQQVPGGQ